MPQVHLAQTFLLYTQLQILFSFKEYGFQKQPSQVCVPKGERYSSCLMSKCFTQPIHSYFQIQSNLY